MNHSHLLVVISLLWSQSVLANIPSLNPDHIHSASSQKLNFYIRDGLFSGGDRAIEDVIVLDIRFAKNQGYERMVIDLEGNHMGEVGPLSKPPYYQVAITPDMKRLAVTVFGRPKLSFDPKRVQMAFKKSQSIKNVEILPLLEKDRWSFVLNLAQENPVEVFELTNPVRIIVDIKTKK